MKDFPTLNMQAAITARFGGNVDLDAAITKAFRDTTTKILVARPELGVRAGDKITFLAVNNAGFAGFTVLGKTREGRHVHCGWADIDEAELLSNATVTIP